jgi:hypothetical protein
VKISRVVVRCHFGDIEETAVSRAAHLLAERGCGSKHLRAEVTDMASMWDRRDRRS